MMIEDQDMDKDSRQLIEQMLAEEEYYFFNKTTKNYDSDYPKKTKGLDFKKKASIVFTQSSILRYIICCITLSQN